MLTNLLATITVAIVTNFTASSNGIRGQDATVLTSYPAQVMPFIAARSATVSNEVVEIVEVSRLEFDLDGEHYVMVRNQVLDRRERFWRKQENWVEEKK